MGNQLLIKEVADQLDLNPKTIRFYEDIGLIPKAVRNGSNYRVYSENDVKRLNFVKKARALGLSIDNIKNIISIKEEGHYPCHSVISLLEKESADLEEKINEMKKFKSKLDSCIELFRHKFHVGKDGEICGLIEHLFEE